MKNYLCNLTNTPNPCTNTHLHHHHHHTPVLSVSPENESLTERVKGVHQLQLRVTAQRDHLVHFLQFVGDDGEAGHEFIEPLLPQVLVVLPLLVSLLRYLVQFCRSL